MEKDVTSTKKKICYPAVGPCSLTGYNKGGCVVEKDEFDDVMQAARHLLAQAYRGSHEASCGWASTWTLPHYELHARSGKAISVEEVLSWLQTLRTRTPFWCRNRPPYDYRRGPVYGTRCSRGGGGRRLRHPGAQAERRQNAMSLTDEGEVPARVARTGFHLPCSWDDYRWRNSERCWKAQHKGRKAWDRR